MGGSLARKRGGGGVVFEWVGCADTPMYTMMSLCEKQILTLKISVTNFSRFRYFADFHIKIVPSGQNSLVVCNIRTGIIYKQNWPSCKKKKVRVNSNSHISKKI